MQWSLHSFRCAVSADRLLELQDKVLCAFSGGAKGRRENARFAGSPESAGSVIQSDAYGGGEGKEETSYNV